MPDSVEYKCVMTSRDFLQACIALRLRKVWFWGVWALLTLLCGHSVYSGIMSLVGGGETFGGLFLIMFFGGLYAFWLWAVFRLPERSYRDLPSVGVEFSMTVNGEGVSGHSDHQNYTYRWDMYSRAVEKSDIFVLFMGRNVFHPLPKRCMPAEGMSRVRDLIRANIPQARLLA